MTSWEKFKEACEELGCTVVEVDDVPRELSAPFDERLGLDWKKKTIYVSKGLLEKEEWGSAVHEVAHVVATKKDPEHSEETDFLSWEYVFARNLGVFDLWEKGMETYALEYYKYSISHDGGRRIPEIVFWGDCPLKQKLLAIGASTQKCLKTGALVYENGKLTAKAIR